MSKKHTKAQASSIRAAPANGASFGGAAFGSSVGGFGSSSSKLSYLAEQPDTTTLLDPSLVVIFRNLAKKDSTTKSKALEELHSYAKSREASGEEIDESFLNAWIKIYPRLTIDVDRRVRQLAHADHGVLLSNSGKKAARYMPDCVGSWVAGCYESDRIVSKSAQDALANVFSTPEKQQSINKVYQAPILEFCRDALLVESARSLSDERSTKAEDADAKYFRLIASSLSLLRALLEKLKAEERAKQTALYEEILQASKIWSFVESLDSAVRRSLLRLVLTCLEVAHELISPSFPELFAAMLTKRSMRSQGGSALDYSAVLLALTSREPQLWISLGQEKSLSASKLSDLVKHGSQGASSQYWKHLAHILVAMPETCLPDDTDQALKVLSAIRTGITRKDEPRTNHDEAWAFYDAALSTVLYHLPCEHQREVLDATALVLVRQYLFPSHEDASHTITARQPSSIAAKTFDLPGMMENASSAYPAMAERLVEQIKTSLPEQSKEYDSSQQSVFQTGTRWFELQRAILEQPDADSWRDLLASTSSHIITASLDTLKSRHGKPYGAAGVIATALRNVKPLVAGRHALHELLTAFMEQELPDLILSPSSQYFVDILYALQDSDSFDDAMSKTLNVILSTPDSVRKEVVLKSLLSSPEAPRSVFELAAADAELQAYISRQIQQATQGEAEWKVITKYLTTAVPILSPANTDAILADLTSGLTLDDKASGALSGLETVSSSNPGLLVEYVKSERGSTLFQNLLLLLDSSNDDLAVRANALNSRFSSASPQMAGKGATATQTVIAKGLEEAGPRSLPVATLVSFARGTLTEAKGTSSKALWDLLPSSESWTAALSPLLNEPLPACLTIHTDLGSFIPMLKPAKQDTVSQSALGRDQDGFTPGLRMGLYSQALLGDTINVDGVSQEDQANIFCLLVLTSGLANDAMSVSGSTSICRCADVSAENQVLDFVSSVNKLSLGLSGRSDVDMKGGLGPGEPSATLAIAQKTLFLDIVEDTPPAFHSARAYVRSVRETIEVIGWRPQADFDLEKMLRQFTKEARGLKLMTYTKAFETPLSHISLYSRVCNELVASLTTLDITSQAEGVTDALIELNGMLQDQDQVIGTIAKQRTIFLIKHIVPWVPREEVAQHIRLETLRLLDSLLPTIADVYGDHWSECLRCIHQTCEDADPTEQNILSSPLVPLLHSSLRLCSTIRSLTRGGDVNEDLSEAWQEALPTLASSFVTLLKRLSAFPDAHNQPLRSLNELLGRQITALPPSKLEYISDLYPLVMSESQPVQKTAFELLHKRIPAMQEQISVDTALDKTAARLPEELLSLVLDPLTLDSLAGASFERDIPSHARGYLSSWLLIFDHFRNASDKVCNDYTAHLKEGDYLTSLLNFTADFLGHSRGKPIDASKFDITIYSFDVQDDPLKDMQWLLTHLYFLACKRAPTLTKTWWMDCRSRQTVQHIESWTKKYISPSVIADALATVSKWADTQDSTADDAITVKTNVKASEITIAREIDAQLLAAAIKLPESYPLGLATTHSINRVAVEAKKWQTWLLNTQGVIAFSNNSIIEGIVAFKRNVNGALKGQTECAICYAVVGPDKQMPTKKCGTCRNLFHGSCLYRWFKSSNSSSCPLCRNAFAYT